MELRGTDAFAFSVRKQTGKSRPSQRGLGTGGGTKIIPSIHPTTKSATTPNQRLSSSFSRRKTVSAIFKEHPNPLNTQFRLFYDRGDLPVRVDHGIANNGLAWMEDASTLDYHHYLPMFFDGLRESERPYAFLAHQGVYDMLAAGPEKVLPVIPQLIVPMKMALNTQNGLVIVKVLKVLQALVSCDRLSDDRSGSIGKALVPYYRQILPVLNILLHKNDNLGDAIDYGQRRRENLGDLTTETLEALEISGGKDAFINIKYQIPTYEVSLLLLLNLC